MFITQIGEVGNINLVQNCTKVKKEIKQKLADIILLKSTKNYCTL